MSKYLSIAFDLDDTLLDTSGLLIPEAAQAACEILRHQGLSCSTETCLNERHLLAKKMSHPEIFQAIANKYDSFPTSHLKEEAVLKALEAFYNPSTPKTLPLLEGAQENLNALKGKYNLYLVTTGYRKAQAKKIEATGLFDYFKKIYIVDGFAGEKKGSAFLDILEREKHTPSKLLSFGNRLSSEIREGKLVGADTCYFAYGEHLGEQPLFPEDRPDYTISHHKDFISTCGL